VAPQKITSFALFLLTNLFGIALFSWPLFLNTETVGFSNLSQATWLATVLAVVSIAIIALQINAKLLDSKTVAIVAVLVALISALRLLGAGAVGIEPMWFLIILSARVFGAYLGFVIALLAILVSALITGGIGPWLAFQALAAGWIAAGVGALPHRTSFQVERILLMIYGVFAAFLFGLLMDLQLWPWLLGSDTQLSYIPGAATSENFARFITFHFATALSWDLPRAIVTATLIFITARPILGALRRAKFRLDSVADWRIANERVKEQKAV
jgi:energy-coupling factor transport system substrate-specific component